MDISLHIIYSILFLALIVLCCEIFTNAIENLGCTLKITSSATASVFASIGTALPETIVPLVAIFFGAKNPLEIQSTMDIGVGAIFGSSFLISTLAMFFAGLAVVVCAKKNKRKYEITVDKTHTMRDLRYFMFSYIIAICASFIKTPQTKTLIALFLLCYYIFYSIRTIIKGKNNETENNSELLICKYLKFKPNIYLIVIQLLLSILGLIFVSRLFVQEISDFSKLLMVPPLILSILITPYATELPEITNSVLWLSKNQDDYAISNLTGALVFQGTIPMAIGIILTPWIFEKSTIIAIISVLLSTLLLYYGIYFKNKITVKSLLFSGIFYLLFIIAMFII